MYNFDAIKYMEVSTRLIGRDSDFLARLFAVSVDVRRTHDELR